MAPKLLSKTERRWLVGALGLGVAAFLYAFVAEPLGQSALDWGRRLQVKKGTLKKNLNDTAQYEALRAEYERVRDQMTPADSGEMSSASLGNLEKIAGACGVFIASVKPQTLDEEDGGQRRVLLDVTAQGDAQGLTRFLYQLETSAYLFRVKRFTISSVAMNTSGRLQCALLISQLSP